jgi:hypothetical protein
VIARYAFVFPVLVMLAGLNACSQQLSVEQRVIATIRDMEARIEAGERRAFLAHIAEDFNGRDGSMSREQVRAVVVFQLTRHKQLQAQLFPIRVTELGETQATASFRALVTGGPGWIPDNGQLVDFETGWILIDDEWMLNSADWTPVALEPQ